MVLLGASVRASTTLIFFIQRKYVQPYIYLSRLNVMDMHAHQNNLTRLHCFSIIHVHAQNTTQLGYCSWMAKRWQQTAERTPEYTSSSSLGLQIMNERDLGCDGGSLAVSQSAM